MYSLLAVIDFERTEEKQPVLLVVTKVSTWFAVDSETLHLNEQNRCDSVDGEIENKTQTQNNKHTKYYKIAK